MVEKSCNTTTSNWGSPSRFFRLQFPPFEEIARIAILRRCLIWERHTRPICEIAHTAYTFAGDRARGDGWHSIADLQKLNLLHTLCWMWPSITILANLRSTRGKSGNIPNPTIGKISCFSFCHQRQCDPQICYLNIYNVYCNLQCNVQSETTACWWWRKEFLPDLTRSSLPTKCSWLSCSPSSCWCFK